MSRGGVSAFLPLLAFVSVLAVPLVGQSVISTHSGIVNFSQGAVYLGNEPLSSHLGRFPSVPKGAELRTAEGRAELLLTPTVFLRIGEKSAIRMIANELSNTRIELLSGAAVLDSVAPSPGTSVTLLYRDWSLRIPEQGMYRIDADTACLWVLHGKVQVSASDDQRRLWVEQDTHLRFAAVLAPDRSVDQPRDAFSTWVEARQQAIAADNGVMASTQDPASIPDPAPVSASNSGNGFHFAYICSAGSCGSVGRMDRSRLFLYQPAPEFSPFGAIRFRARTFRCTVSLCSVEWYPTCRAVEALVGTSETPLSGPVEPYFTSRIPRGLASLGTLNREVLGSFFVVVLLRSLQGFA